jgi:hypothetical protein
MSFYMDYGIKLESLVCIIPEIFSCRRLFHGHIFNSVYKEEENISILFISSFEYVQEKYKLKNLTIS